MSDLPVVNNTSAALDILRGNKVQQTAAGGGAFIRFDAKRTGEWVYGMEAEPVTGDVFSLDVASLKHGYVQWHMKKANRLMVPINQPLPEPQEPIHYTDAKGKPQVDEANEARSFEGSFEDGVKFNFEGSTFGARKAIDAMLAELFTRAAAGSVFIFPQVELGTNSYDHAQFGKVYEPVLTCVAWFDGEGNPEGDAAPAIEQKAEEPEPEPEAPKKRRRRSAA